MDNAQRLKLLVEANDLDLDRVRVIDAEIVSVNYDNTVNIIAAGVPMVRLPSDRKTVGTVKVLRTHDGQTFVI